MLCHQHPADSAHAACQRCQRGLCRSCSKLFLQRLCTHCIEQSASQRARAARRTLWLMLPVFALASWSVAMALPAVEPRLRAYFAALAGMAAAGSWLGLRRWRRAPALTSGFASLPEGDRPLLERAVWPALAGMVFWPWLLIETLRDMRLANRLRAFVPAEHRARSFGMGEASLAFACMAAALTLGAHGFSRSTPVAGKVWRAEAKLAKTAQQAVRTTLGKAAEANVGTVAAPAADEPTPVEHAVDAPSPAPAPELPPPLPEVPEDVVSEGSKEPRGRPRRRREQAQDEADAPRVEAEAEPELPSEPARDTPPVVLDRRFVPGSELAKQALSGKATPEGYVTPQGRVVIKAPPPSP